MSFDNSIVMPKVSVVIPTHNRPDFLRSAVRSVLNQTFQDFEIVVVDDASDDNTQEVVRSFNDKKIRYIRHDVNRGEAGTRNTGVMNSIGRYIAFLDDDDEWLPEKLRSQVDLLENSPPKVGGVYTGYVMVDGTNGKILGQRVPPKRGDIYNDMLAANLIGTPSTVLLKRECIEKVGLFDENISYRLDQDMWLRISKHFYFECIEEPLVKYCIHENRLSNDPETTARGLEDMLKKYGHSPALNTTYYSNDYLSIGVQFCYNGNIKKGMKAFLSSIKLNPFNIRAYFNLVLSLLGTSNFKRLKSFKHKLIAHH